MRSSSIAVVPLLDLPRLLVGLFSFGVPGVRQDGVLDDIGADELLEMTRLGVEQSHGPLDKIVSAKGGKSIRHDERGSTIQNIVD